MITPNRFHLTTDVHTDMDGSVHISTILLPVFGSGRMIELWNQLGGQYETCIFWDKRRDSEVMERYESQPLAEAGHEHWVNKIKSGEVNWQNTIGRYDET